LEQTDQKDHLDPLEKETTELDLRLDIAPFKSMSYFIVQPDPRYPFLVH
jgi:hypothetical protein